MTPDEAGQLLARCAVFDNRKPSQIAMQGWAVALAEVPLDADAFAAVARFYGATSGDTGQRWIQPHHVRHHRAEIRAARIREANLVYDGTPDETGRESAKGLRQLIRAAGDGRIPAQPITAALTAGTGRPSPELIAQLADVGRDIYAEAAPKTPPAGQPFFGVNALGVPCPHCLVPAGQLCKSRRQPKRADVHPSRLDAALAARAAT
ncbi:hypothetical protein ABIA32_002739 [Streptacidiphilus sp. MAP12-20]|uniref:zinc finger domain-containing protein n=1 Tax=Streptacidiphilus sp. MAP12-20 TaxID=3156299 RepID=UPI00351772F6